MPRSLRRGRSPAALAPAAVTAAALIASAAGIVPAAATSPGTPGQALAQAQATGRVITVSSLTTASSLTTVSPTGRFAVTESLLPVRVRRDGRWVPLNPALHRAGGRLVPAATASLVSLSDGGPGSLARLADAGWTLAIGWPGSLPPPSVSGSTAIYAGVPVAGANLVVTVSSLGTVTVVAEATDPAASRALSSFRLLTSAPGLSLSTDLAGDLAFAETGTAEPVFTAQAPRMWDSAPLPKGAPVITDPGSGEQLAVPSGLPARSSTGGPGGLARPAAVPVAVSGGAITLTPPAASLTGHGAVYPLYTSLTFAPDVTKNASAWSQISSGAGTSWMQAGCLDGESGQCLQAGYCDSSAPYMAGCGDTGLTRTLLRFPLPGLPAGTKVATADVYLENVWTAACMAEPLELWAIPPFSRSTAWSSSGQWKTRLERETFHGYGDVKLPDGGSCGPGYSQRDLVFGTNSGTKKGVRVTGGSQDALAALLQSSLDHSAWSVSLGLRAADESTSDGTAYLQWRQFMNKAGALTLQFTYDHLPSVPASVSSSPGGGCQTDRAYPAEVGADGLTLYAKASDPDGDTGLSTTFAIYAYPSGRRQYQVAVRGTGLVQAPYLSNAQITRWQPHGATRPYTYYYTARSANSAGPGPVPARCYFSYSPLGPAAPRVTGYPVSVQLGQYLTNIRFAPGGGSGKGCPRSASCPVSYTYQLGTAPPVTLTAATPGTGSWNARAGSWTGTLAVPQLGPLPLTVTAANAAGNSSPASAPLAESVPPARLADGYFSGGRYPDVLFAGTGSDPSLWLAPGTGGGAVGQPVDIGSLGNGGTTKPGPAQWTGALILHGDFTGDQVQDVMAYWAAPVRSGLPAPGSGAIVAGTGDAITLNPGTEATLPAGTLCDPHFDNCASEPADLVAAGDASQQGNKITDLIGYLVSGKRSELNLYTDTSASPGQYSLLTTLSKPDDPAPDGGDDWGNYALATAQLPDAAHPNGDPADTVLIALNRVTGQLYESVDPGCPSDCGRGPLIGSPGTWASVQDVPWAARPPALQSADVTSRTGPGTGNPEIWTRPSTSTALSYAITGTRTSLVLGAGQASPIATPADDWPLTGTASDVTTGQTASLHGTHNWSPDPLFTTVLSTTSGYLVPAAATIPAKALPTISISIWFKTTSHGGVLASLQNHPLTPGHNMTRGYAPLLYIGQDGRLYGLWPAGTDQHPLTSVSTVSTGTWQHAVLQAVTSGAHTTQVMYLNGRQMATTATPALNLADLGPQTNLTLAAGYLGGAWPSQPYKGTAQVAYFAGQVADITITR
jgi:hypothetical protein